MDRERNRPGRSGLHARPPRRDGYEGSVSKRCSDELHRGSERALAVRDDGRGPDHPGVALMETSMRFDEFCQKVDASPEFGAVKTSLEASHKFDAATDTGQIARALLYVKRTV